MLVQGVRNLRLADEYECRDILSAFENFDQLALEIADIGLEVVALPALGSPTRRSM